MRESHRELVKAVPFTVAANVGIFAYAGLLSPHRMAQLGHEVAEWSVPVGTGAGCVVVGAACVVAAHRHGREALGEWSRRRARLARYRARWGGLVAEHGLRVVVGGERHSPSILGLTARPPHADVLTVSMVDGQSPMDFHDRRKALAAGFGVAAVQVQSTEIPARIALVLLLTAAASHAAVGPADWPPTPTLVGNSLADTANRGQTENPVHEQLRPIPEWNPGSEGGAA